MADPFTSAIFIIGLNTPTPKDGDIVIKLHPHSREHSVRILSPEEFKQTLNGQSVDPTAPLNDEPWLPFSSKEDFEFAALVRDAKLNRDQTEKPIKLIQRCQSEPGPFTFNRYSDLTRVSERASKLHTQVTPFFPVASN